MRPTSGPGYGKRSRANGLEHKRKPPRGIYINHDDIVALACPEQANRSDDLLASMDREINALLTQVCKRLTPYLPPVAIKRRSHTKNPIPLFLFISQIFRSNLINKPSAALNVKVLKTLTICGKLIIRIV